MVRGKVGAKKTKRAGQEEYAKIRDSASGGDTGTGDTTERWWGNADRIEEKRKEIRSFTEKLKNKE